MKVSVIIATYKRKESLRKAIDSIISQTYSDIEVIVVDDNADPQWNSIVQGIVDQYSQVIYIKNLINKGSAETRNIGIYVSTGEYITFLDDDDVYLSQKIEFQLHAMVEADADYSVTDLYLYDEHDRLIDKRIRTYIKATDRHSLQKYHLTHHITGTDSMMFRKDYLVKIGGFAPINIGDEFYLMERAIDGNGNFLYIPGCCIKAYVHTEEIGLSSGQSKIDGEQVLFEYKKLFFPKIDGKYRRYIKMRHYAVIAFAEIRMKKYFLFIGHALHSFLCAPMACARLLLGIER